jgi:hypothetical protein
MIRNIARDKAHNIANVPVGGTSGVMTLQLLNRIIGVIGDEFPRDIVRVIMIIYRRMNPPLTACMYGMVVVVTNDTFRWKDDQKHDRIQTAPVDIAVWSVVCGYRFAIAATDRGFYSWGSNKYGCLGFGNVIREDVDTPSYVWLGKFVIAIACGCQHVMMIVEIDSASRLYGWGEIIGLGLKYAGPRLPTESDYYNGPMQIDIVNPVAVVCGMDYSLVLAKDCVWLCHDHPSLGLGPCKLGFSNVTRMFACCHDYIIWSGHQEMDAASVSRHNTPPGSKVSLVRVSVHDVTHDTDYACKIKHRYDESVRWIKLARCVRGREAIAAVHRSSAGCRAEDYLSSLDLDQFDEIIGVTGRRHALIITTLSGIYSFKYQGPLHLICKW